jgi:hypothetical protein
MLDSLSADRGGLEIQADLRTLYVLEADGLHGSP